MDADTIRRMIEDGLPGARAQVQGDDGVHFEATVVAEASAVYASSERLYLAANRWAQPTDGDPAGTITTAVHAFDLSGDGAATHLGAGEVPGPATLSGGLLVLGALVGNELLALAGRHRTGPAR